MEMMYDEAIEYVNGILAELTWSDNPDKNRIAALNTAVDALSKGEDDYQKGVEHLKEVLHSELVEQLKIGNWTLVEGNTGRHRCNKCRSYAPFLENEEEHLSYYCPNCGARMTKEDYNE